MGASFLGCHAGPRLFTQRDGRHQEKRSAEKELADTGKFINRKRLRPESDYFADEPVEDKRAFRGDAKKPGKSGALSSTRSAIDQDRSVANRGESSAKRGGPESADAARTRSNKSRTTPATGGETARRPVRELLDEPLLDERVSAARVAKAPAAKTAAKALTLDEDPFQDAVASRAPANRSIAQIATLKHDTFDDLEDVSEAEEVLEEMELEEMKQTAAGGSTTAARTASTQIARREIAAASQAKQKSLPEDLDETDGSTVAATPPEALHIDRLQRTPQQTARDVAPAELDRTAFESRDRSESLPAPSPSLSTPQNVENLGGLTSPARQAPSLGSSTPGNVGNGVSGERRQQLKNTIDAWRREMDRTDDTGEDEFIPPPNTANRVSPPVDGSRLRNNDFSPQYPSDRVPAFQTENVDPLRKSQGAVLNGELILDTSSLPSRFQRTPDGLSDDPRASSRRDSFGDSPARQQSNAGASIDILPGMTPTRSTRPSGQIALQSLAASNDKTYLSQSSNAHFEQFDRQTTQFNGSAPLPPRGSNVAGAGISETRSSSGGTGPKMMPIDDDVQPPSITTSSAPEIDWDLEESDSRSMRGWKGMLLVIGCLSSAIVVGLGLRRRQQLVPVRVPHPSSHAPAQSDDPTT